jgi:hypothetical protein
MKEQRWYQLYEAAILELDAARLKERIDAAEGAIREREAELSPGAEHEKERQTIEWAKQTLKIVRRNELKPPG